MYVPINTTMQSFYSEKKNILFHSCTLKKISCSKTKVNHCRGLSVAPPSASTTSSRQAQRESSLLIPVQKSELCCTTGGSSPNKSGTRVKQGHWVSNKGTTSAAAELMQLGLFSLSYIRNLSFNNTEEFLLSASRKQCSGGGKCIYLKGRRSRKKKTTQSYEMNSQSNADKS